MLDSSVSLPLRSGGRMFNGNRKTDVGLQFVVESLNNSKDALASPNLHLFTSLGKSNNGDMRRLPRPRSPVDSLFSQRSGRKAGLVLHRNSQIPAIGSFKILMCSRKHRGQLGWALCGRRSLAITRILTRWRNPPSFYMSPHRRRMPPCNLNEMALNNDSFHDDYKNDASWYVSALYDPY